MLSRLYKLVFDISVCYSLGAFLLYYFNGITLQASGFILLLIAAFVSVLLGSRSNRRLSLLAVIVLPCIEFVISKQTFPEVVAYVLTWGYVYFVISTERFVTGRGEFLNRIRRVLSLSLILPIIIMTRLSTFVQALRVCSPYLVTAIVSTGFLLRHLRTDYRMKQQMGYYRQQIWEMLLFLVVSIFLTLTRAPQNLLIGLKLLFLNVIQPVIVFLGGLLGAAFGGIMYLLLSGVNLFINSRELTVRKAEIADSVLDSIDVSANKVTDMTWILPLLYSVGAILVLAVLFFFVRWLMGEKYKQELMEGVVETREEIMDTENKHNTLRWGAPKEPRAMIRYYYKKYLLRLRDKKVAICSQDTTGEIDRKYSTTRLAPSESQKEASKKMKKLYRKARYQMMDEITSLEAENAKQLYHSMKSVNKNS